jgi:HD domain
MSETIAGIKIPDSQMAKDLTELIRDKEPDLLYHHSRRVYLFGVLTGQRKSLAYDPELLYVGAMFHDIGLTEQYRNSMLRFEVDGANAACDFLRKYGVPESSIELVWDAIALHTTPGIPEHKKAVVALVTDGVEMDVLGIAYNDLRIRKGLPWWPRILAAITSRTTSSTPSITVWLIVRIAHPAASMTTSLL